MADTRLASREALVRKADFDRYLAALFAPVVVRQHLIALYAFNYEVAKTAEIVSQPTLGLIRLQWWREAIEEIYTSRVREHDTVKAIAAAICAHNLPRSLFDAMIEARESDLEEAPFADMAALEAYADATSGHLMRLALRILGAPGRFDEAARDAGIAYALTGLLRALPHLAVQRRLMVPLDAVQRADLSRDDIFSGRMNVNPPAFIATIVEQARAHFRAAASARVPRNVLPALLPAALVPLYIKKMTRGGFDPFRDAAEIPVYRRQIAMLTAMARGKV